MDLYGCYFEYAGELSRKYGLIIACVNTKQNTMLTGKGKSVSVYNRRNQSKHDLGNVYTDAPLTFDMEVVSEFPIDGEWRRKIQKWLFNQTGYQKLYLDRSSECVNETFDIVDGVPKRMYLNCKFVNPEKIEGNGGIIGYKFTVECDSRMAWMDPVIFYREISDTKDSSDLYIIVDTDRVDYTYPKVEIETGSIGGEIKFINETDDPCRSTTFINVPANTKLAINGNYNYVSGGFYDKFSGRKFPRLLDGVNHISLHGDIRSIKLEWQNMRYL